MKKNFKTNGILVLSLGALFASGVAIGRLTAPGVRNPESPATAAPADAEAWMAAASRGLVKDLQLDEDQQQVVRAKLEPVATALFSDQKRALFQMHLRLLEFHDTLAGTRTLTEQQGMRLAVSRAKLKDLIIRKFPTLVRGNPSLAIGGEK